MGLFGPSRQERQAAAAASVAPYGFSLVAPEEERLKLQLAPFVLHSTPSRCRATAFGRIDAAEVWAFDYDYTGRDSEGNPTTRSQLLIALHHPGIAGGASFAPDARAWGGVGAAIDLLLWVPPFTFVKAFQLLNEARNPDRVVGDPRFDELYVVRAADDATAQRAIPPRLRETAVRLGLRGAVELRENLVLYSVERCSFDGTGLLTALRYAAPLALAAMSDSGQAYR